MKYEVLEYKNSNLINKYINKNNLNSSQKIVVVQTILTLCIFMLLFINLSIFTFNYAISKLGIVGFIPWFTGLYMIIDPVIKLLVKEFKDKYLSKIKFNKRNNINYILGELVILKEKLIKEKNNANIEEVDMVMVKKLSSN